MGKWRPQFSCLNSGKVVTESSVVRIWTLCNFKQRSSYVRVHLKCWGKRFGNAGYSVVRAPLAASSASYLWLSSIHWYFSGGALDLNISPIKPGDNSVWILEMVLPFLHWQSSTVTDLLIPNWVTNQVTMLVLTKGLGYQIMGGVWVCCQQCDSLCLVLD